MGARARYFAPAEDVQLGSAVSSTATIRKGYPKLLRVIAGMLKQPWCGRRRPPRTCGAAAILTKPSRPLLTPAPRAPFCRRWTLEKEIIGAFRTSLSAFVVPPGFHVFDFRMGGAALRLVNPDAKGPAAPGLDHLVVMAIPSLHLQPSDHALRCAPYLPSIPYTCPRRRRRRARRAACTARPRRHL